jgi:hypothetical protein
MTDQTDARARLVAAVRVDPDEAADALLLALLALQDAAEAAGDVP